MPTPIIRPQHISNRPINNALFGEPATLIRERGGARDSTGRFQKGASERISIICSSEPATNKKSLVRDSSEAGVRLESMRVFYVNKTDIVSVIPGESAGDKIEYNEQVYVVHSVEGWMDDYLMIIGIRKINDE